MSDEKVTTLEELRQKRLERNQEAPEPTMLVLKDHSIWVSDDDGVVLVLNDEIAIPLDAETAENLGVSLIGAAALLRHENEDSADDAG